MRVKCLESINRDFIKQIVLRAGGNIKDIKDIIKP